MSRLCNVSDTLSYAVAVHPIGFILSRCQLSHTALYIHKPTIMMMMKMMTGIAITMSTKTLSQFIHDLLRCNVGVVRRFFLFVFSTLPPVAASTYFRSNVEVKIQLVRSTVDFWLSARYCDYGLLYCHSRLTL